MIDFAALADKMLAWLQANVLQWAVALEIAIGAGVLAVSRILGWRLQSRIEARYAALLHGGNASYLAQVLSTWSRMLWLLIASALFGACFLAAKFLGQVHHPFSIGLTLCLVVAVIRMSSSLIKNRVAARFIEAVAIGFSVLSVFGVLEPATHYLNSYSFTLGAADLSIYSIIKGAVFIVVLLELAKFLARLLERRISSSTQLTPSLQVLWIKAANIGLILLAVVIGLKSVGFSLTSVTVFSGAVGVGIGFGLQKIFSNFISGIILLLENSIKPGDTIEVVDIYGQIKAMNARFVSMVTRDGKEYLIPNEKFIVNDVVNWTYSSSEVRVRIPVGVPYDADVEHCLKLLEHCVAGVPRILADPAPRAVVRQFGPDAVDLELRIWIKDPESGVGVVRSEALLAIWRTFKEHGIVIPYPQRDLHVVSVSEPARDSLTTGSMHPTRGGDGPGS